MWDIAIWFFCIMFAINGMFLYVDAALPSYTLVNPISNQTIIPAIQPDIMGAVSTQNSTSTTNATGGPSISIWDVGNSAWNKTVFVYNLLTGGFIWSALSVIIPPVGSISLFFGTTQGLIGIFMVITGLHFWRGIF